MIVVPRIFAVEWGLVLTMSVTGGVLEPSQRHPSPNVRGACDSRSSPIESEPLTDEPVSKPDHEKTPAFLNGPATHST